MHVCMLTDYFLPHVLGGTERAVYELGRQLVRKGCEVSVVTLNTNRVETHSLIEGMRIHRLPAISITKLIGAQLTLSPMSFFWVHRLVNSVHPDIIHAHNLYFQLTMIAPFIRGLEHVPLVTTLHLPKMTYNRILLDSLIRGYEDSVGDLIVKSSDRLIAVSQSVMKYAIEDLNVPPSKITFIPNGVAIDNCLLNDQKPSNPIVTYIGRLIENKGPQYLVEAGLEILSNHPDADNYIIGDGPLRKRLVQQVASLKLEDRIHILGSVPDVLPILQKTSVFVRPSLTEGMSLAILEAMTCGLPVVASNIGGNTEVVKNGVNGYLVPPADAKALAEVVGSLLDNRDLARAMGENARKTVQKLHNWERIAEKTLELYTSLA
jgi:glycosyltransferase involved in cell wall biosynthesis